MGTSGEENDPMVQKLEMVLKKGEMVISVLEKKGVITTDIKVQMEKAKTFFSNGDLTEAYRIAQQCVGELLRMKDIPEAAPAGVSTRRGKGVYALIRDNTEEMNKRLEEWRTITEGWRDKGYSFEDEASLFHRDFDEIEKRFISIGGQIEKAEIIRGKINRMRDEFIDVGSSYKKKIDEVENATFRLDRLDNIERRLSSLETTLRSVKDRFTTMRNRISRFNRQGLNTSSLVDMLENDEDLDYLEKQFNIYESNVEFLLKEKQKLKAFSDDPMAGKFQKKFNDIERIIDDPWKLDQVVEKMLSLEKDLSSAKEDKKRRSEEDKRRDEIKKSLEKYIDEGFKVDMVSQLLDEDINLLEEEFDIFLRQTAKLRSLKERLFKLDATGFEDDVSRISTKLFDPTNIEAVESELEHLKEMIQEQKVRSQRIEDAIKEWTRLGFKVSNLENALKKDMDLAMEIYEDYSVKIKELMEFDSRLQGIKHRDLEDMVRKVQMKIRSPEFIETIRKEMAIIDGSLNKMEGLRAKRKEFNDLLKGWRAQGYKMDCILPRMRKEETVEGLEDIIVKCSGAIETLASIKNSLASEERGWFPQEEQFIRENIMDPERSEEVLGAFTRLKNLNIREEKKRGEISRKLKELTTRGIDISRIEPFLIVDKETLDKEYDVFKENVKELLTLKAGLLKEAKLNNDNEKELFAKSLNDPYSLESYKAKINGTDRKPQTSDQGETRGVPTEKIHELKENGKTAYRQKRYNDSLRSFENVLSIDPSDKEARFYLKKVMLKLKNLSKDKKTDHEEQKVTSSPGETPPSKDREAEKPEDNGGDPNCLSCKGTGKCIWCEGTGKCSTCGGTGNYLGETCHSCNKTGECNVCKGTGKCSWCSI
ncbi:MAG: hypothetical protein JW939_00150 [Candidatus Thermoplasmatota archaeon]|nr:hypothetical protein [Candidatus Thermoplasmatota archaeon]